MHPFEVIHGKNGDGDIYLSAFQDAINQYTEQMGLDSQKYYVIAPQFNDDSSCTDNEERGFMNCDNPDSLIWHQARYWMTGSW